MGAAVALAKSKELPRERAIELISHIPYLVAMSHTNLLPMNKISLGYGRSKYAASDPVRVTIPFLVSEGNQHYEFPPQPFLIIRRLTLEEFKKAAPWLSGVDYRQGRMFYYEIHTD